jgi:high-affinity nickel permease
MNLIGKKGFLNKKGEELYKLVPKSWHVGKMAPK